MSEPDFSLTDYEEYDNFNCEHVFDDGGECIHCKMSLSDNGPELYEKPKPDLHDKVMNFFKDEDKTDLWFETPNPLFGNVSPDQMIETGRVKRLEKYIDYQLSENETPHASALFAEIQKGKGAEPEPIEGVSHEVQPNPEGNEMIIDKSHYVKGHQGTSSIEEMQKKADELLKPEPSKESIFVLNHNLEVMQKRVKGFGEPSIMKNAIDTIKSQSETIKKLSQQIRDMMGVDDE